MIQGLGFGVFRVYAYVDVDVDVCAYMYMYVEHVRTSIHMYLCVYMHAFVYGRVMYSHDINIDGNT